MSRIRIKRLAAPLAAAALLAALVGCGSDSSGDTTAAAPSSTSVSIPPPTSPIPTTTTAARTTTSEKQKKPSQTTTTAGAGPAPCTVPEAYQDFKFIGIDCTAAVAVATDWDRMGKVCNTIDNPNSPLGFNRTCSVEGFSCRAKRDVHSDGRFVACTQGGQSIRFTWLPA
jgi:hypothetical protein